MDPSLVKLHLRRGRALLRLGHLTHASDAYSKASEITSSGSGPNSVKTNFVPGLSEKEINDIKADAKNGLKSVLSAKSAIRRLGQLESEGDHVSALNLLTDLSGTCPCCLLVLTAKCRTLCKLGKWSEAREIAEHYVCTAHISILKLAAHPHIVLPGPMKEKLVWEERIGKNIVIVDTEAVVQAMLSMGSGLSEVYLLALKNLDLNRNCSADIMTRIVLILEELSKYLKCTNHFPSSTSSISTSLNSSTSLGDLGERSSPSYSQICKIEKYSKKYLLIR